MGEKSRIRLPAMGAWATGPSAPPSLDEARRALGGRARSGARTGWGAVVQQPGHGPSEGVVLCDGGDELDVWIGEGLIARVTATSLAGSLVPESAERFQAIVADVRRYWSLVEGQPVQVTGPGMDGPGILREQCRYGALVERVAEGRAGRKVIAVGFRRLSPA